MANEFRVETEGRRKPFKAPIAANETSRIELLERDVAILLKEVKALRLENKHLRDGNRQYEKDFELVEAQKTDLENRLKYFEEQEKEELGFYIKSQREARGMSVNQMARAIGVTDTTLYKYERGEGRINRLQEIVYKVKQIRRGK